MEEKLKNLSDTFKKDWPWGNNVSWDSCWALKLGTRQQLWSTTLRQLLFSHFLWLICIFQLCFWVNLHSFLNLNSTFHKNLTLLIYIFFTSLKFILYISPYHCTFISKGEKYSSPINQFYTICLHGLYPTYNYVL